MLEGIPVFKGLKARIINQLIYTNEPVAYAEGTTIIKSFDPCNSMMLLECGELEVYTEFDSHEFVLEKLHPGTVINFREYMIQDVMHVNIRALKHCRILHITEASMKTVLQDEEELEKNMFLCQSRLFAQDKLFPLDYVQKIPRMLRDPRFTEGELTGILRRRNILKNVVFRKILGIRKLLAKPSLSRILEGFKDEDGGFDKEAARAKIHSLYGDAHINAPEHDD
jgi:CRP-like cAMP-binding protein